MSQGTNVYTYVHVYMYVCMFFVASVAAGDGLGEEQEQNGAQTGQPLLFHGPCPVSRGQRSNIGHSRVTRWQDNYFVALHIIIIHVCMIGMGP